MGNRLAKERHQKLLEASQADKTRHDQLLAEMKREHEEALKEKEAELKKQLKKMQNENQKIKDSTKKILTEQSKHFSNMMREQNYKISYQIPDKIKEHKENHPNSFYIQIIGTRGAGKSTFINQLLKGLQRKKGRSQKFELAKTDFCECTKETHFFDITDLMTNLPEPYNKVFLVDQPGIGGLIATEADYLLNFGPGK